MSDYQEVEVKLYVTDFNVIAQKLDAVGAELTKPRVFERNVRYENAEQTLTGRNVVVRLREDTRVRLTYKEPTDDNTDDSLSRRFEAEVEVSDFDTMETILRKFGYQPYLVYEKYRTTYEWGEVEIVLDEMPYGKFVEIEGTPDAIENAIDKLELKDAPRYVASYVALFDAIRNHLKLDFHDITFANFEGVIVPQSALGRV